MQASQWLYVFFSIWVWSGEFGPGGGVWMEGINRADGERRRVYQRIWEASSSLTVHSVWPQWQRPEYEVIFSWGGLDDDFFLGNETW